MKLLLQTAIIFFATLLTAGLVALGEPAGSGRPAHKALQLGSGPGQAPATSGPASLASWQAANAGDLGSVAR